MVETFLYGALGALIPEVHRWMNLRDELEGKRTKSNKSSKRAQPPRRLGLVSLFITAAWVVLAGAFATALPGEITRFTAVYAGMSLPATITLLSKRPFDIDIDTIELAETRSLSDTIRAAFYASCR